MHVPWGVIKQRPHFVAENLSKSFDVKVCSFKTYRKSRMVQNVTEARLELMQLFIMPLSRLKLVSRINLVLTKLQLLRAVIKADIIWMTHPLMFEAVGDILPQDTKLVYDCMDDALEFPSACADDVRKVQLFELEKSLVNRCDIVFTSSDYLRAKLTDRYGNQMDGIVVNNAIHIPAEADQSQDSADILRLEALMDSIAGKKLLYLGAISEWMDFDLILNSLERIPEITYVFVGLCDILVPRHERLVFFGPIEHRHIFRAMKKADALIMPFHVNELIKSVNPVKIYDYIYACKPAIVVGYGETARFEDFIYLYRTQEEYMAQVEMLVAGDLQMKRDNEECMNFVSQNTWPARVAQMLALVNSIQ